jgi:hypothetical protein
VAFIFADSPRLYTSTNPWKITATFHSISSTREEYIATIEDLKASAPLDPKKGQKRTKPEQSHLALIVALEKRIEVIDAELNVSNFFRCSSCRGSVGFSANRIPNCFIFLVFVMNYENEFLLSLSQRVHKVQKKIEQRRMLMAQAEVRQTRTRRQTQKPDYVYNDELNSDASTHSNFIILS